MNKSRKAYKAVKEVTNELYEFMDKCQSKTNYYINLEKAKEDFASFIDQVIEVCPKEYDRIFMVISKTVDVELQLIGEDYWDNQVYISAAEHLDGHFDFIEVLVGFDDMI